MMQPPQSASGVPERHAPTPSASFDSMQVHMLLPTLRADYSPTPAAAPTYYDRPIIKKSTWKWPIPFYFWLGGIAGGAALIGTLAHFFGGPRHRSTVRNARYLTLVLAAICPIPLIQDLGRPARFHHMLRTFKISSPLSVGTWVLSAFGLVSGALAVRQAADDGFVLRRGSLLGRLARLLPSGPLAALQGVLGICLGGYTGTLLAVTAVPLWAAAGVLLGPLFLATAVASGAAALTLIGLVTGSTRAEARGQVDTIESVAAVTQLSLVIAREALVPPTINAPLRHGRWGMLYRYGAVGGGMVGPLALRLAMRLTGRRSGRVLAGVGATLTLAGALAERFAITEAGKASADDPRAYHELTRGAPGEARPTAQQQAQRVAGIASNRPHVVVPPN